MKMPSNPPSEPAAHIRPVDCLIVGIFACRTKSRRVRNDLSFYPIPPENVTLLARCTALGTRHSHREESLMRWVKFSHNGEPVYGILNGETIQVTAHGWADVLAGKPAAPRGEVALSAVHLLNPIERPGKIVCVGLNYMDHVRETNG